MKEGEVAHICGRRATMHRNGNGPMVLSGLILAVCLVMVCALSLVFGSRSVSPSDILHALSASSDDIAVSAIRLRIPRTVLGLLVGAGLGVAGTLMQGISRNPLADPSILGFNTGAALAIVCSIVFFSLSTPAQSMSGWDCWAVRRPHWSSGP
ncbi:iron chelate uptake ABC transporter family permease subunit [Bifidobacterium sp. B4142]|nr:iron chelate uptake ABC transporter family permease subunit [Bifidobacterium sp. B4142]